MRVVIRSHAFEPVTVRVSSWAALAQKARSIIVPQIAEALREMLLLLEDPDSDEQKQPEFLEYIEMCDLLTQLHSHDQRVVENAIYNWTRLAEAGFGEQWIEFD